MNKISRRIHTSERGNLVKFLICFTRLSAIPLVTKSIVNRLWHSPSTASSEAFVSRRRINSAPFRISYVRACIWSFFQGRNENRMIFFYLTYDWMQCRKHTSMLRFMPNRLRALARSLKSCFQHRIHAWSWRDRLCVHGEKVTFCPF